MKPESALSVMLLLAAIALAGCSSVPSDEKAFAAPTHLTAKLATPLDIDLKWKDNASAEAGYFVEYSPRGDKEFFIIDAVPPNSTKYRHPRLMPQTRFVFRIRPYFGPASGTGEIVTGKEGPQQPPARSATTNASVPAVKKSIRSMATFALAAPTDFKATLIPPAGAKLEWKNHASDADGYLLEIKPEWSEEFKVSAFLGADAESLVTYNFPFQSKFVIRVRPFFYGRPSNLAEQTTGLDPTMPPGKWVPAEVPHTP
jgi:Fibronectin type III domain